LDDEELLQRIKSLEGGSIMLRGIALMIMLIASVILLVLTFNEIYGLVPNGALLLFPISLLTINYTIIQIIKEFK